MTTGLPTAATSPQRFHREPPADVQPVATGARGPWCYEATFRALGHRFAFRTDDRAVADVVRWAFRDLASPVTDVATIYSWVTAHDEGTHTLLAGSEELFRLDRPSVVLEFLMWHVNQQVTERTGDHVLLHAAAVQHDGVGLILTGPMEAGKTTLVTALVRSGCGYLTDETVAIDPADLHIRPYPKPLSLDRGSWTVHAVLDPGTRVPSDFVRSQWLVPAPGPRSGPTVERVRPAVIVATRYVAGAATVLRRIPRVEMLRVLVGQTFGLRRAPRRDLAVLREAVAASDCYQLEVDDLAAACRHLRTAVERRTGRNP